MGNRIILYPTDLQEITWVDAARRHGMAVTRFLAYSADWMARYSLEVLRQKQPDHIAARLAEKGCLHVLLKAAKRALQHLPKPFHSALYGTPQDPEGDLRRAVDAVEEHLNRYSEEWE
jgi:hypothetical protein